MVRSGCEGFVVTSNELCGLEAAEKFFVFGMIGGRWQGTDHFLPT